MIIRKKIESMIAKSYQVQPEYPWRNHKDYAVYRHKDNHKWFALIMDLSPDKLGLEGDEAIDVINVKVDNAFIGPLRKKKGIYPAYHMNKSHWISINLNEFDDLEELIGFIDESYELTK